MAAEQAVDTGVCIIHPRLYPDHRYDVVLIIKFQVRYFGLLCIVYVYACHCDTYQLIPDWFTRLAALCVFRP